MTMKYVILLSFIYGVLSIPVEDESLTEFVNGNHKFSGAVYKELAKQETGNFLVSPLSAEIILALTNEGAQGETSVELVKGLSLPSTKNKIQKAIKSFLPNLKSTDDDLKLETANKIYAAEGVKLENDFQDVATTVYDAGVENVDFAENVKAAATINQWVEGKTNQKIKDLISPDAIDSSTKLVLVNTLYFKGKWLNPFEKYATYKKDFYKTKGNAVEVDTMNQVDHFNFYENPTLKTKFLELPYKGGDITMIIALPNEVDGLKSLAENNIEQLLAPQPFTRQKVDISLPRFKIETEIQFVPILKKLGVKKLFSDADLSGLSSTDKNLVVSQVIQKTFINVTEEGTEAAAATAVIAKGYSLQVGPPEKTYEFHADHPFVYLIKLKETILFAGRYVNPAV